MGENKERDVELPDPNEDIPNTSHATHCVDPEVETVQQVTVTR